MATIQEVRQKLFSMSDEQFDHFRHGRWRHSTIESFGFVVTGAHHDRPWFVEKFADNPNLEGMFCELLDLPTEQEKQTRAAIDSARQARWAVVVSVVSAVVSLGSFLVALAAILR